MTKVRIQLLGATDTVTGSRTLLTIGSKHWLIDCGLFQGPKDIRKRNWSAHQLPPLEGVILTHAHLDHSGYLPRLVKSGFHGPVHCTSGTGDLLDILLKDAAYLEEEFATYANQSGYTSHKPALPLFTIKDAQKALSLVKTHKREAQSEWIPLTDGVSFRFIRGGHIIGASLVQFAFATKSGNRLLTFSGDLGNDRSLTMKAPEKLLESDVLVLESTYGGKTLERTDTQTLLAEWIQKILGQRGVLVIPAFAVGRAQELLHRIRLLEDQKRIPICPVILDSPMAEKATSIFLKHGEDHRSLAFQDCYKKSHRGTSSSNSNDETEDDNFFDCQDFLPKLFEVATTANDSMLACMRDGPFIVISASGMLHGGRILHHLKHRLPDKKNMVLFTGYQANGTKGRWLLDRAEGLTSGELRIHHQEVTVKAKIAKIDAFSSHADQEDLLTFLKGMIRGPQTLILSHGESQSQLELQKKINSHFPALNVIPSCQKSNFELDWSL